MPIANACYARLSRYCNRLKKVRRTFPCPLCEVSVHAAEFESHCLASHGLDPELCCVWCLGEQKWSPGCKNLYADHLLECFRKFVSSLPVSPRPLPGETFPVPGKESNDANLRNDCSGRVDVRLDARNDGLEKEDLLESLGGRIRALETENENLVRKVRRLEGKREGEERPERGVEDRILERLGKKMERRKKIRFRIDTVNVYGAAES